MKHRSTTRHLEQKDRLLSGQQLVKDVQSDQKHKSGLARLWHPYFGTRMVFCLSTILGEVKPLTATITWHYRIDWAYKSRKNGFTCKKVQFYIDNEPWHKSMKTMVKLNELCFELLPHPSYSPNLAPSDYWLFADLKKMLQGKRFGFNEEIIAETEAYFESKDESFYKKGIEKL